MTTAVYAGSFDPITLGHIDIIKRGLDICDVIVAVGNNESKKTIFTPTERVDLIKEELGNWALGDLAAAGIEVVKFDGLLVNFCVKNEASIIIRGLRALSDFEHELQIANANRDLNSDITTIWLPTQPQYSYISSSLIKEIVKNGGDVRKYVPERVALALQERL